MSKSASNSLTGLLCVWGHATTLNTCKFRRLQAAWVLGGQSPLGLIDRPFDFLGNLTNFDRLG